MSQTSVRFMRLRVTSRSMTAPYKGKSEPWKKVCTSQSFTIAILDCLGGRNGITGEFRYATLGIQILAGIIEQATGEKCIDFANKNPRKYEWYSDPQGTVTANWGLCMSARDMAVIGAMVLMERKSILIKDTTREEREYMEKYRQDRQIH